jgi:predicted nucleotidyltransferase
MAFGLSKYTLHFLENLFKENEKIEEVILYGSRAKGNFAEGSDIDITLKGERLNGTDLSKIESKIENSNLPYLFDISVYKKIKNKDLLKHINRMGKVIYKKELTTDN